MTFIYIILGILLLIFGILCGLFIAFYIKIRKRIKEKQKQIYYKKTTLKNGKTNTPKK